MSSSFGYYAQSQRFPIPPVSGMTVWLDGQDPSGNGVIPSNGATISTWVDKTGNGNNGSGGSAPTYSVGGAINGYNSLNFAGTSYYRSALATSMPSQTDLTIFIVLQQTSYVSTTAAIEYLPTSSGSDHSNTTQLIAFYAPTSSTICSYRAGIQSTATTPANGTAYCFTTLYDGTNNTVYLNGTAQTPVASSGTMNMMMQQIGSRWLSSTAADNFNGYIAEIITYPTNLSSSQIATVYQYIATKWGI